MSIVLRSLHCIPRRPVLAIGAVVVASACTRAPAHEICPRIDPGDLVISELRGNQADSFGSYIEVYNAAGRTLDLQGLWIRQVALDGDERSFVVRDSLEVPAGGFAVIGTGPKDPPTWMDYSVGWDISGGDPEMDEYPTQLISWSTGFLELEACDSLIDEVFLATNTIPAEGTLACGDLDTPPDVEQNDDTEAGCWCVDAEPSDVPLAGIGLPGTPGRANRCP